MSDEKQPQQEVAERVRVLLKALALTQDEVAERSGGRLTRVDVNNAANGRTLAKTDKYLFGLGAAVGVSPDAISAYLRGAISLDQLMERRKLDPNDESAIERKWMEGHRAAWRSVLMQAIGQLRDFGDEEGLDAAVAVMQLDEVRSALRQLCERHGDNDWPDNLSLADVIRKHLAPYLDERR